MRRTLFPPVRHHGLQMWRDVARQARHKRGFLKSVPSAQKERKAMRPGGPAPEEGWGRRECVFLAASNASPGRGEFRWFLKW